jgi:hypothetical protein
MRLFQVARKLRPLLACLSRAIPHPNAAPRRRGFRPGLEFLESRLAPAVDMWTGANYQVDNNWSDGANWSLGRAPTSAEVAVFTSDSSVKSNTSVVDQNFTVGGLQIDGLWRGTINVPASLTLASGSVNEWDSGFLNPAQGGGRVINNGTLTLNSAGGVVLGGGGVLQNNGTVNQTGAGDLLLDGNGNVATTLVNAAGATYDFQADSSIDIYYASAVGNQVTNAGLIEKTGGTGTSWIGQSLTNTGTLDAASGTLQLRTSTSDANGIYTAAAGATLDLTDGYYTVAENGTFNATGAGTILLDGGVFAVANTTATLNVSPSVNFQWTGGTVNIPTNDTLTVKGNLSLIGTGGEGLAGGGTLIENGTITQSGSGSLGIAGNSSNTVATTLVIPKGSVYDFAADSGIAWGGAVGGVVTNAGTIEKTVGSGISAINVALNNTGTLDAVSGTLQLRTNTSDANGTYTAAAGATIDLTDGYWTFSEAGTFSAAGAGTILLDGGVFAVANTTAALSITSTTNFQWAGGTVDVPTNDTLTVHGNLTFNGTANEGLAGGGTLIENGIITQSGSGSLGIAGNSSNTVATTLVIPKGSVYDFASNSGIAWGGAVGGVVTNMGTIEKTAGGGSSGINVAFDNTGGTLTVTTGTLTLDSQGGENTGGVFNVSAGAVLDLTGGNSVNYSGTYTGSGSGTVLLDGGVLNVSGGTNGATFNLPGNLFVWTGGTIYTAAANNFTLLGSLKITGNGTEYLTGGGELNIGTATAAGTLNDTATANTLYIGGGSTLGINARGTLNLADDTISGSGLLLDQGSLVKTAGTSGATISATVDSQGKVTVNNGTLLFNGVVDQVFNGVLTGGTWTASSTTATAATLDISSATFNTIGVSASVTLSGPNSRFDHQGALIALAANQGTFNLSSGVSFATPGNFTNSGSMTLSPGSVLSVNGAFAQTSTGKLTQQLGGTASSPTFGSVVSTGAVSLGGTLTVTSTVVPAVGSSFEILNNESALAISGTFAGLPEGATFTVKVGTTTMTFKITYVGGNGRSIVLTRIS